MFKCQKCGCCCKFFKCPILTAENLCPIYENRPNICKVADDGNNDERQKMCNNFREYFKKINEALNNTND